MDIKNTATIKLKLFELFEQDMILAQDAEKYLSPEYTKFTDEGIEFIKEVIDEYGSITRKSFGFKEALGAWMIVQHADEKHLDFKESYLKLMENDSEKAFSTSRALLADRISVHKDLPQVYGSQLEDAPDGTKRFASIEDINVVDEKRKSMRLPSLYEYAQKFKPVPPLPEGYVSPTE